MVAWLAKSISVIWHCRDNWKTFCICVIPASLGPQIIENGEGNPVGVTVLFARPYQEEIVTSISRSLSTATHPSYAVLASVLAHNRIP